MPTGSFETDKLRGPDSLWLGKAVPRYTSYPPATAFTDAVGNDDFARKISEISENESVSVYVHIPFCRNLCLYCGCNTRATNDGERIREYILALSNEIKTVASLRKGKFKIGRLHFGGGSPNVLCEDDFKTIMRNLHEHFDIDEREETAVEADPRLMDERQVSAFVQCGVSRVSLGVQDFDEEVQKAVNRIQPYERVEKICASLRENGINSINFDLMYGLPLQTEETIARTARLAAKLNPQRISLFSYAHVPQIKKHQKALENIGLPDLLSVVALENAARTALKDEGYAEIGMDHFARPEDSLFAALKEKRLRRNFQGYTDDVSSALIGLGASAISKIHGDFFQNSREEKEYVAAANAHGLSVSHGYLSDAEDLLRAEIIETLMCRMECDLREISEKHGFSENHFREDMKNLEGLASAGTVKIDGGKIVLSAEKRAAIRVICRAFDKRSDLLKPAASRAA